VGAIDRLVLWNIDLTLLDVGRVSRDAFADAFRRATGRPLVSRRNWRVAATRKSSSSP
jgi:hypothetical protein